MGAELARARSLAGQSLVQLSGLTGLPETDLVALEAGDLERLGPPARAKAALRVYGNALRLDAEALLRRLQDDEPAPVPLVTPSARPTERVRPPRWLLLALLAFLGGLAATWLLLAAFGDERASVQLESAPAGAAEPAPETPEVTVEVDVDSLTPPTKAPEQPAAEKEPTGRTDEDDAEDREKPTRPRQRSANLTPPEQISVQVLDGRRDGQLATAVRQVSDHGYAVDYTDVTVSRLPESAVFYGQGFKAEAKAFRRTVADVPRLQRNRTLTADADLHVVVGQDWAEILRP